MALEPKNEQMASACPSTPVVASEESNGNAPWPTIASGVTQSSPAVAMVMVDVAARATKRVVSFMEIWSRLESRGGIQKGVKSGIVPSLNLARSSVVAWSL